MNVSLREALALYKKPELYSIAKEFGIEKISRMNKVGLIELLCTYLLNSENMKRILLNSSEEEYLLFCRTVEGESASGYTNGKLQLFQYGYIVGDAENGYFVPYDVKRIYHHLNLSELKKDKTQKEWFCKCMEIAGALYGIIPEDILLKLFNTRPEFHISELELLWNLRNAHDQHPEYLYESGVYVFSNRFSKEQLRKLLEKQKGTSFYIPSKNEINEFSEKGYLSNNSSYRELISLLEEKICLEQDKTNAIVRFLWGCNSRDEDLVATIKAVIEQIEFMTGDQCSELIKQIVNTYNHTRMLKLRGHTLVEKIRKQPMLRNMVSLMGDTEAAAIIAELTPYLEEKGLIVQIPQIYDGMKTIQPARVGVNKIYPNDPCYCGSGKKYKKCCGRLR